jgi:L-amino acid N-acyltransferase YncA
VPESTVAAFNKDPRWLFALRSAHAADWSLCVELLNAATTRGTSSLGDACWTEPELRSLLLSQAPTHPRFVAEQAGRVIGFAALVPHHEREAYRPTVELLVCVDARCEGRGVGRALVGALLESGRRAGFHVVLALPLAHDLRARRLLAALGFTELGALSQACAIGDAWSDLTLAHLPLLAEARS